MIRAFVTPTLLLAVLIQAAFGCFVRHSHESPVRHETPARPDAKATVSADHGHRHGHVHGRHQGHGHASLPAAHIHFGGQGDDEHRHESSGDDTYSYVAARAVVLPPADSASVGHGGLDLTVGVVAPVSSLVVAERPGLDRSRGRPIGRRLSLLGAWLV